MRKNYLQLTVVFTLLTIVGSAQQNTVTGPLKIAQVSLLVKDYDEALQFYTSKLGFIKTADSKFGNQRWLTIAPSNENEMSLVLVKAEAQADVDMVGKQAGDRTLLVLETDQFDLLYHHYEEENVNFLGKPATRGWGRQVQFTDLYGNHLVLLEVKTTSSTNH